jgi:hypothetical protein
VVFHYIFVLGKSKKRTREERKAKSSGTSFLQPFFRGRIDLLSRICHPASFITNLCPYKQCFGFGFNQASGLDPDPGGQK